MTTSETDEKEDIYHCPQCAFEGRKMQVWGHLGAKHSGVPVRPIRHGTVAGYLQEKRRKIPTCRPCRIAWNRYYFNHRPRKSKNA